MSSDVTPRYCFADPVQGGRQAVAESYRNICAVGALPLAITDNMNFGNPEKPRIMGQFAGCVEGMAEACRVLDYPVVSGNVSLYNETNGVGILPTPTVGGVGLLTDGFKAVGLGFKNDGDVILLVGETEGHLGQSLYLREILGLEEGPAPAVDLETEKRHGTFVRGAIQAGLITASHDVSDGGLQVALAEMAMAGNMGADLSGLDGWHVAELFGEDQGRYVLTVKPADLETVETKAAEAGVTLTRIGTVGGDALTGASGAIISVADLIEANEAWLPNYMNGKVG
jgi:phosphoribosylformylglycinamidine synthase